MTAPIRPIGEDDLNAFVDGRLDPDRCLQVERYLAENPGVAARVADWRANLVALRAATAPLGRQPIPARMDVRRLAAARAARRWSTPMVAASLAAMLVVGVFTGWTVHRLVQPWTIEQVAEEALTAHRLFASAPGPAQEVGWADPGFTTRMAAPDLSAAGYTLTQRQVVATAEGIGSLFIYRGAAGNRISVFVRPMLRRSAAFSMRPVQGAPGWAWASDGLGVSLISSEPTPGLHGLADEVRRRLSS
jgi:anti-sigma factor RsiW